MGFMVLERVAERHGIVLSQKRFSSVVGSGRLAGQSVLLVEPQTYMNLSGRAVSEIFHYFGLDLKDLIVVYDDMDLEVGRIKIASQGSPGGHKGVASIIESLGHNKFARIKVGIGRPEAGMAGEEHVLGRFRPEEKELADKVIETASLAVEVIVSSGVAEAQGRFNRKDVNAKEEEVKI